MAIFNKGILGGFSGKAGSVIGANWKGRTIMRSLPSKRSNRTLTQAQMDQQEKFKLIVSFLAGMSDFLKIGFVGQASRVSGFNVACSYNLQRAVTGLSSPFSIDFSLSLVSQGALPNAGSPAALAAAGNQVVFNWTDNSGVGRANATDKVMLVVYCPETGRSVYTTGGAARSGLTHTLDASVFAGKEVETWIAFRSADGKLVSDSVYVGHITLTP